MFVAGYTGSGFRLESAPILSEFMAANESGLLDEDRQVQDWIEIGNPDDLPYDLTGHFLTDDPERLTRWSFPSSVTIPARGYLVVFASGKNRRLSGAPLHTDFRLAAEGEYLALVARDGRTVLSQFAPRYPKQYPDVAFGRPATSGVRDLLSGATTRIRVPTASQPLAAEWYLPGFVSGPEWVLGTGFGIGFDAGVASGAGTNLAPRGTATQSSTLAASYSASAAIDGNPSTFTHTASTDNQSTWSLDLGREWEVARVVLRNRADCCQSRLRDLTVSLVGTDGATVLWKSALLNAENVLGGPSVLELDLFDLNVGPVVARYVQVVRAPDPDLSGSGGQGNNDDDNVLSLGEVEVYGGTAVGFGELIRTDVGSAARGVSAAVAIRSTFRVEEPRPAGTLTFKVRYDDGFAAFLNGERIASTNAPAVLAGTSVATGEQADTNAVRFLDFEVPASLLVVGENVLSVLALNRDANDDDLLLDARLEADGPAIPPPAYFEQATPGAANSASWYLGRLDEPSFSTERGFRDQPFDLVLTVEDPAAQVFYTLDGSEPTPERGIRHTAPVRVDRTRVVRARAVRADYRASPVASHTYVFVADVIRQPAAPGGFPARWAEVASDYEMDPAITQSALYGGRIAASLRALPSVCFATDTDNLFGASRGIYANPENRGLAWERPVSMEWIEPEGGQGFQVDAGLRIQGGYFRQRGVTQKHSLRVVFKDLYGPGRLDRDLFGEFGAAREFDTLVFRAGANDGYAWSDARDTEQFLRDEFGRQIARAMGMTVPHGRFVHVYLNGLYWGLYNLTERPNEDFSSTYFGGAPEEWDAVNSGEIKSGDLNAWNQLLAGIRVATNAVNFLRLQGLAANGIRDPSVPVLFDVQNYADYMLANIWGGNWDWPNKNFWFGRRRTAESTGFKFYLWDFENTMGNNRGRSPLNMVSPRSDIAGSWVGEPHARLKGQAEYRLHFADRVQKHFFGSGPLAPAQLVARYRALATEVASAVIAETARWGDDNLEPPQDLADWERERDWLLNTYLPQRTGVVLGQLRNAGLFPALDAPILSMPPGPLTGTTPVHLATPARHVLLTFDGSDPRLPGGEPNPAAVKFSFASGAGGSGASPTFVPMDARWRYLDRGTDPGLGWAQPGFDDASWPEGAAELGYGDGDEATLVGAVDTDPAQGGIQRNATTYFRGRFEVTDPVAWESLSLEVRFDDAVAVYVNGQEVLRTGNLPANADYRTFATADSADNAVETRTGLPTTLLRPGINFVAAEVHQRTASSSDISFALSLTGVPRSGPGGPSNWNEGGPIAFSRPTRLLARSWSGTEWSPLLDVWMNPDVASPASSNLLITEIAYLPPDAGTAGELAITTDRDDFEFVEIMNLGPQALDLSGVRLAGGVRFEFGPGVSMPAGARWVVVANRAAFLARFGADLASVVAGEFVGQLANEGEVLRLETAAGQVLHELHYLPGPPWPVGTDGPGSALTLIDPNPASSTGEPGSWRVSRAPKGSPGSSDARRFEGNPGADLDQNGWPDLVDYVLGASFRPLTARLTPEGLQLSYWLDASAEDAELDLQSAPSASGPWTSAFPEWELASATLEADGSTRRDFRAGAATLAQERYFRLVVAVR